MKILRTASFDKKKAQNVMTPLMEDEYVDELWKQKAKPLKSRGTIRRDDFSRNTRVVNPGNPAVEDKEWEKLINDTFKKEQDRPDESRDVFKDRLRSLKLRGQ
jgi:hypothetical protein